MKRSVCKKVALINEVNEVDIWLVWYRIWQYFQMVPFHFHAVRQPANVNDRGHFFWCLQRPNLCNYGDSTQRRGGKWKEIVSQHCGDCLSGQARFNPQNFSPLEAFIQARNNSSGISLRCPGAASHLSFAPLLFRLVSDLICFTFNLLLLYS